MTVSDLDWTKAIDLIKKMLDLDPKQRIETSDAILHPYVSTYHDSEDEPIFDKKLDWSLLESEKSAEEWKNHMYGSAFSCGDMSLR